MKILIPTDAFPPVCGGSGWSTCELARGLRARGHDVTIVRPRPGTAAGVREADYDGFRVVEFGAPAPDIPFARNYYKSEKLTRSLGGYLATLLRNSRYDIVHAQHVMTTVAAIDAAQAAGIPVVAPAVDRIASLVEDGREGLLYDPGRQAESMADALVKLKDVELRTRLGSAARERAVRDYSWAAHCKALEAAIQEAQWRRAHKG